MTITAVKEKLHRYIDAADEIEAREILDIIEEGRDGHFDNEFWDEMDRRVEELKTGKVQGVSWEEVQEKIKAITG